jgi:glutamyl/glutaminyl-tRNA synthetase
MSTIITRFAPSPTGYLHVGGARTALFSWLLARHSGGKFLLRIEDTDLARSTETATTQLLEDLRWLGLHWDNAELVYQSKRLAIYNKLIDDLIARGLAYKAYETAAELDAMRADAQKHKRDFLYRRRPISEEQIRQYEAENRPHVVRFATPVKDYKFDDAVLGKDQGVAATQVQDFVIRKSDGMPTYHFAVVVDDAEMNISHVMRGQEHLLNTVNHIALQEALGYPRPIYAHLPIILNSDGSKMGKRDRDKKIRHATNMWLRNTKKSVEDLATQSDLAASRLSDWLADDGKQLDNLEQTKLMPHVGVKKSDLPEILVHDFRSSGYLPEALLNFLALLGWNPGGDREQMSLDEIVQLFSLENIGKSNAKFDRDKLLSFNTTAAAAASEERLIAAMRDYLHVNPDSPLNQASDAQLAQLLKMKAGFRLLREVDEASRFLFVEYVQYDPAAVEKVLRKQNGLEVLREIQPLLADLSDWSHDEIEKLIQAYCQRKQLGLGKVAQPIRVAVSGSTISPPIFQSLEFLGKPRTLARIARCLELEATK